MTKIPADELEAMPTIMGAAQLALREGSHVVELGNKKNQSGLYRDWYVAQGMRYTCLDWNAEDGAIAFDFGKEIPEDVLGQIADAKLVTNFGFMEHVYTDQVQGWYNLNRLCAPLGCYLAMVMPYPGAWEHHGVYQPHVKWYEQWLEGNGYEIEICGKYTDRVRPTIVVAAHRVVQYGDLEYYHPADESLVHITNPATRVNAQERNCGVKP